MSMYRPYNVSSYFVASFGLFCFESQQMQCKLHTEKKNQKTLPPGVFNLKPETWKATMLTTASPFEVRKFLICNLENTIIKTFQYIYQSCCLSKKQIQ